MVRIDGYYNIRLGANHIKNEDQVIIKWIANTILYIYHKYILSSCHIAYGKKTLQ